MSISAKYLSMIALFMVALVLGVFLQSEGFEISMIAFFVSGWAIAKADYLRLKIESQ